MSSTQGKVLISRNPLSRTQQCLTQIQAKQKSTPFMSSKAGTDRRLSQVEEVKPKTFS